MIRSGRVVMISSDIMVIICDTADDKEIELCHCIDCERHERAQFATVLIRYIHHMIMFT